MTRQELRARIRGEVERQGYALVASAEVYGAFAAPGEDTSISFDQALRGFAAYNGWKVRRGDLARADTFIFYPRGQEPPPPFEPTQGS